MIFKTFFKKKKYSQTFKKSLKKIKKWSVLKLPFFLIFFYDVFMNYFEIMDCCFDI